MKTQSIDKRHRFYTYNKPAKISSGTKLLTLTKHSAFRLEKFNGRDAVIKDGVVYFVKPELVKELKARSVVANVKADYAARLEFLNLNGFTVQKALVKNLAGLAAELQATDITAEQRNGAVFYMFETLHGNLPLPVKVVFALNEFSAGVYLYVTDKSVLDGWAALPLLEQRFLKFVKYLKTKFDISVKKPSKSSGKVLNVALYGKPFSGFYLSFSANWNL